MSSINYQNLDRHIDIACRKSTPNSLDDQEALELGEVNLVLERYFREPVPAPRRLDFAAAKVLVLAQPDAKPVIPWYQQALMPGHLAVGTLCCVLLYLGVTMVPVTSRSVPAVEARIYAAGTDSLNPLPPPTTIVSVDSLLRQKNVQVTEHPSKSSVPGVVTKKPLSYATFIVPQELGGRPEVESSLRDLSHQLQLGDPTVKLVPSYREVEMHQKMTIIDIMRARWGRAEGTFGGDDLEFRTRIARQPIAEYLIEDGRLHESGIQPTCQAETAP